MKLRQIHLSLILLIMYNFLFWNQSIGLNMGVFTLIFGGVLSISRTDAFKYKAVLLTALSTVISGIMVVLYGSTIAKIAHVSSFLVWTGFLHTPELKTILFSIRSIWAGYRRFPLHFIEEIPNWSVWFPRAYQAIWSMRLIVFPLGILALFYAIYSAANPRLDALGNKFADEAIHLLAYIQPDISVFQALFWIGGFVMIGGILFNSFSSSLWAAETKRSDYLKRVKKRMSSLWGLNALRQEYKVALFLVLAVNLLLFINNALYISDLILSADDTSIPLYKFVHEGTYLLIGSILLSMGIMLWYFRGNLNFYSKNGLLKYASYAWIIQNIVLVVTVCIRNYRYIYEAGLTHKRIGVIIFLLLTVGGLYTLYRKIAERKSWFYLIRVNSTMVFGMMILLACVDWDVWIARYNTTYIPPSKIDLPYLFSLSEKTLPIYANRYTRYDPHYYIFPKEYVDYRIQRYQTQMNEMSWKSWTYAHANAVKSLSRSTE